MSIGRRDMDNFRILVQWIENAIGFVSGGDHKCDKNRRKYESHDVLISTGRAPYQYIERLFSRISPQTIASSCEQGAGVSFFHICGRSKIGKNLLSIR